MNKKLYRDRRKKIGFLLQSERGHLKLSQQDVAQKLGVRQELISKIEVGERRIDINDLISYCEALDYSLMEIAWKIETYLHAEGLLPPPKNNIKNKRIRVNVSWIADNFSASFENIVPKTVVFTANTFAELQNEVKKRFNFHIEKMIKAGKNVPRWLVKNEYRFGYKFSDATSLLKAYTSYLSLAAISRASGINVNQLSQYANGMKKARPNQMKRIMDAIHDIGKELMAAVL
jgi:transcriptional regulator with XRE-family HTH domain